MSFKAFRKHLRDISKRADLQLSETSPVRSIKDVSPETSLRSLSLLRDVSKLHLRVYLVTFKLRHFLAT